MLRASKGCDLISSIPKPEATHNEITIMNNITGHSERNDIIKAIKKALQERSGKAWSVTGGRGTAWGWITINAPAARLTAHSRKKAGAITDAPEDYEIIDTGVPGGYMTEADRAELGKLLNLGKPAHLQGESIPASAAYRQEYLDRAAGRTPSKTGEPYWD